VQAHPRRATDVFPSRSSGTLDGTGTRWRRVTAGSPKTLSLKWLRLRWTQPKPYLNLRLRQPHPVERAGGGGLEALLDVRNIACRGYRHSSEMMVPSWSSPRTSAASAAGWHLPSDRSAGMPAAQPAQIPPPPVLPTLFVRSVIAVAVMFVFQGLQCRTAAWSVK